jgi:hypothetical protein
VFGNYTVHDARWRRACTLETNRTNNEVSMQDLRFSRRWLWRKVSSGMLRRVALVRTDVSEELGASFIMVTWIGELGTMLALTRNRRKLCCVRRLLVTANVVPSSPILVTLMKEVLSSSETSVLTKATRRNIPDDTILNEVSTLQLRSFSLDSGHCGCVLRSSPSTVYCSSKVNSFVGWIPEGVN